MKLSAMPGSRSFKTIESIGRTLPDVEVTTTWGQPTLKVRGKMFVCIASHKSAEPNTLVVMMDFTDRDALIEDNLAGRIGVILRQHDHPRAEQKRFPGVVGHK